MLSMASISNTEYYSDLAKEDYYQSGGEPPGRFINTEGNAHIKLSGQVQDGQLKALLTGYNPINNKAMASNAGSEHRPGLDLTFSAPKSVSVAWATGTEQQRSDISTAQQKAVEAAMNYMESKARVRMGKGGKDRQPAKLLAASYEHSTSRAVDPQLHTHVLVASHGINKETGQVRSLDDHRLFQHKMSAGAAYRAALADELQKLGYSVSRDGETFRLNGSDEGLEKAWSKRREDILKTLESKGLTSAKAAKVAALDSRETKGNINRTELFARWKQEAANAELDFFGSDGEAEKEVKQFDKQAVLQNLTDHSSTFNQIDLERRVFTELQGIGGIERLDEEVKSMIDEGELIQVKVDGDDTRYTTREMLELEKHIINFAESGQDRDDWKVKDKHIQQAISNKEGISEEQQSALKHIAKPGQVAVIEGAAGTGKSYMLASAKDAFESSGYKVHGVSLAGKAAAELESGSGIKSQTIHSYLNDIDKGRQSLDEKSVLVMDEAGMTDTRLMSRVVEQVESAGAKLILVGDTEQLQSIGAGGTMGAIATKIGSAEILTVRRQEETWQKDMANDFRAGRASSALAALQKHDALHITDKTDDAIQKLAKDYVTDKSEPHQKIAISGRRRDVAAINKQVRTQLQGQGKLDISIDTTLTDPETGTVKNINLAEGDRIKLTKNNRQLDVKNGDLATVTRVDIGADGQAILDIQLDRGQTVQIDTKSYPHLMHGYAISAHASQGSTVNNSYFYASNFSSKQLAYVAGSRHKKSFNMYASKEEVGQDAVKSITRSAEKDDRQKTAFEQQQEVKLRAAAAQGVGLTEVDSAGNKIDGGQQESGGMEGGMEGGKSSEPQQQQQVQQQVVVIAM